MNTGPALGVGAAAGAAATVPMTWSMELMHRLLPHDEGYSLPPRQITEKLVERSGAGHLSEKERLWLSVASHFAYGAAAGALFEAAAERLPGGPLLKGTAYGIAVWAGSYLGLIPALGLLRPATHHSARRNALMIAAHAVWGSALGLFADLFEQGEDTDGLRSLSGSEMPLVEAAGRSE